MFAPQNQKALKRAQAALDKCIVEIKAAAHEIVYTAINVEAPNDRVRVVAWMRRLMDYEPTNMDEAQIHNEYLQYLRIGLQAKPVLLYAPFKDLPPAGRLVPLGELLCNQMADRCPKLPKTGPLKPLVCHKTEDGRAVINISKNPNGGVFCYMAVTSDPAKET